MKQGVFNKTIHCIFGRDAVPVPMRTWYIYRTLRPFNSIFMINNISLCFREDRKSFGTQDRDSVTAQDYVFYWRDMAPLIFEQVMIETKIARKYKA